MIKPIKKLMMKFTNIFKDENTINEKNLVGFSSFMIMVVFAVADIVTGIFSQPLIISDTIFNSFVIVTLGSFGIDGFVKIFKKK
jgi:hypothetical protein